MVPRPVASPADGGRASRVARPPKYVALADELWGRWATLPPGTLVESEHQVADEFAVGRLTAREAVRELERRFVVRRVPGRGTFTAHRIGYRVTVGGIPSFRRAMEASGQVPGVQPVERRWTGRGRGRSFHVERILTCNELVASFSADRFDRNVGERIAPILGEDRSIIDALEELEFAPMRSAVRVAMTSPPLRVVSLLGYTSGAPPVWRLESTTSDGVGGEIVHRSTAWMRPDMFELVVELGDGLEVGEPGQRPAL